MEAADLLPGEQVDIVDIDNGARLSTYVIEGPRDSGVIGINGAAARLISPGDLVILIAYTTVPDAEARELKPRVVFVDEHNAVLTEGADPADVPEGLSLIHMRAGHRPTAVVSGGTRGIGLALSLRLRALGHHVLALYRGDEEAAEQAEKAGDGGLTAVRVDVGRPAEVRRACAALLADHGAPDVLVNNAGINRDRPFLSLTAQDWDDVVATNLSGPFHLSQALAPAMLEAGGGSIVNVGATTAIRPRTDGANYCASKAGLLQLTKCMALELAPRIRVNALIPGFTDTPEVVERYRLDDPARLDAVLAAVPGRRLGTPEDIADALEFLVTSRSAYVTGQQLIVDGGHFMG